MSDADHAHMAHALVLGRRHLGLTWPNPSVGCVIVGADGDVIARGVTGRGGRPHGETVALEAAGAGAAGGTAYVSLEPCCHHGQTPPCTDALIAAGIARVVSAMADPDPRVSGQGHAALRAAGIAVETDVLSGQALCDHAGFVSRALDNRPHVHLKLAVSSDGAIAWPDPARKAITGEMAHHRAHLMRAFADAIMVGVGTATADDPLLTCRLAGLEDRSPVRIVMDTTLRLDPASKLVKTAGEVPLWLICGEEVDAKARKTLEGLGVLILPTKSGGRGVDIEMALQALAEKGITRLLVEGGAGLAGSLIDAHLADEVSLFTSADEIGAGGLPAIDGHGLSTIVDSPSFEAAGQLPLGPDMLRTFRHIQV